METYTCVILYRYVCIKKKLYSLYFGTSGLWRVYNTCHIERWAQNTFAYKKYRKVSFTRFSVTFKLCYYYEQNLTIHCNVNDINWRLSFIFNRKVFAITTYFFFYNHNNDYKTDKNATCPFKLVYIYNISTTISVFQKTETYAFTLWEKVFVRVNKPTRFNRVTIKKTLKLPENSRWTMFFVLS